MNRTVTTSSRSEPLCRGAQWTPLVRHCALLGAVLIAAVEHGRWDTDIPVLLIIALLGALNLTAGRLAPGALLNPLNDRLSPFVVISGWLAVAHLTGGVRSPFIVGLWLELILLNLAPARYPGWTFLVFAVGGLAIQELPFGMTGSWRLLALQTCFLSVTAAALWSLQSAVSASRDHAARVERELMDRLKALETEAQAIRALEQTGERTARVAHSLVNSIHSLRGFTSLLADAPADVERVRPVVGGIRRVTETLEQLVGMILPGPPQPGETGEPICAVVESCCEEIRGCFPRINVRRRVNTAEGSGAALYGVFRDVLTVLLRNAAEAMNGSGVVNVAVDSREGNLFLRVGDQGPGLPEGLGGALFTRPLTTKATGHGVGLYLASRSLEACGGRLSVDSTGPDGTVFCASLPCAPEEELT